MVNIKRSSAALNHWTKLTLLLAWRDVQTRYKHSMLGFYWAVLNPLLFAAVFSFVFGIVLRAAPPGQPYAVYLVFGLTFWNLFANGLSSSVSSITGNASLVAKVYFPREILPGAAVLARVIDFGFSLIVLAGFLLVYHVGVTLATFWLIGVVAIEVLFTLGMSFIVSSVNVLYRDVSQIVGILLMAWLYSTPVIYSFSQVSPRVRSFLLLDPMAAFIEAERQLAFGGGLPHPFILIVASGISAVLFIFGLWLFRRIEPLFGEVM